MRTNGKYPLANKKYILFSLVVFLAAISCKNATQKERNNDASYALLENGDLIYRHGNGFFSEYFKGTSKYEQIYSHGGIVLKENNKLYVIHSEASELTGIGGVKKEPINSFLKNISTWGVYRLDTTDIIRNKIVLISKEYLEKDTPFDLTFDSEDDSKIYCTQLIALSVNKALDSTIVTARNKIGMKPYYAIDDTYLMPNTIEIVKISD